MRLAVPAWRPRRQSVSRPLVPSLDLSAVYEIADLDQIDALNTGRLPDSPTPVTAIPTRFSLPPSCAPIERAEAGVCLRFGNGSHRRDPAGADQPGRSLIISEGLYGKTTTLSPESSSGSG